MAGSRRREREVVAVAFNQKEQRVLEKSLATLRLQASYSLKLLDLHNRTVKVHFRQMKDRVSRIKSHLEPDEIHELRRLEAEGKLQPMYPAVSLGSALKIAAAARRLNSSASSHHHRSSRHPATPPGGQPRAKSALPRVSLPEQTTPSGAAPHPGALKRSNSVTGVFIDVPDQPPAGHRPGSASLAVGGGGGEGGTQSSSRPGTAAQTLSGTGGGGGQRGADGHRTHPPVFNARTAETIRANGGGNNNSNNGGRSGEGAAAGSERQGSSRGTRLFLLQHQQNGSSSVSSMESLPSRGSASLTKPPVETSQQQQFKRSDSLVTVVNGIGRPKDGARSRKTSAATSCLSRATNHSHAPFSSHVATEREAREREEGGASLTTPRSHGHAPSDRKPSCSYLPGPQDDVVDDLGEDLFAERRAELLEEEQYRAAVIGRRKDKFLRDIDQYLKDNPPLSTLLTGPAASVKTKGQEDRGGGGGGVGVEGAELFDHGPLFRRRKVEFDANPTYLPEADYRAKLMGLWREMSKCRYLRVPDERIDLSGINTLATDTMRLFQVLRHREPLANAWVE